MYLWNYWFRCTEHVTSSSKLFTTYILYSDKGKVLIANSSLSLISRRGYVICTPTITLSSILHVPSFSANLLSVPCLTKSLNCLVIFFPSHCIFQNLVTGQRIDNGSAVGGLYYLDVPKTSLPLVEKGLPLRLFNLSTYDSNLASLH